MPRRTVARVIAQQLRDGVSTADAMQHLAAYLITHRETKRADHYIADIEADLAAAGVVVADVVTARPIDEELRQAVRTMLAAPEAKLRESVDPTLIGGIIVRSGGKEFDSSLRSRLQRLKSA